MQHQAQQLGRELARPAASPCEPLTLINDSELLEDGEPNTVANTSLRNNGRLDATPCDATITVPAPLAQLAEQLTLNQ